MEFCVLLKCKVFLEIAEEASSCVYRMMNWSWPSSLYCAHVIKTDPYDSSRNDKISLCFTPYTINAFPHRYLELVFQEDIWRGINPELLWSWEWYCFMRGAAAVSIGGKWAPVGLCKPAFMSWLIFAWLGRFFPWPRDLDSVTFCAHVWCALKDLRTRCGGAFRGFQFHHGGYQQQEH